MVQAFSSSEATKWPNREADLFPTREALHRSLEENQLLYLYMSVPKRKRLLVWLFAASLVLSAPSIRRIPSVLPFLQAEVRAAAPQAIEELRAKGLWVVNTDLLKITREENAICFHWEHRYSRPRGLEGREYISTCIDDA